MVLLQNSKRRERKIEIHILSRSFGKHSENGPVNLFPAKFRSSILVSVTISGGIDPKTKSRQNSKSKKRELVVSGIELVLYKIKTKQRKKELVSWFTMVY